MAVLLMGFMDIKLPFVTDGSPDHNRKLELPANNDQPAGQDRRVSQPANHKYLHYTSAQNRGIFPHKKEELTKVPEEV